MLDLNSVVTGVVSGLMTGILIWFFRVIWLSQLKPWTEDMLYKGVRIDGFWISELVDIESTHKEEIFVVQRGHSVFGTIKTLEGQDQGTEYIFHGTFNNLILTGTYESKSKYMTDRGTFTLKISDNGGELAGVTTYIGDTDGELCSANYLWQKKA